MTETTNPQRGARLAILGDLHFEKKQADLFEEAKKQILSFQPDALASLGDLGGYSYSGSYESFFDAFDYFSSFNKPFYTLMGNHDLEGKEFTSDEESVSAFCNTFNMSSPYYAVDLGHTVLIFLSSTGYRNNPGSCHEVRLDEEQIEWFRTAVEENKERPIFVFSHCPIFGSSIRVLQNLHMRIPNAWVNHSTHPEALIEIVSQNPQVKLWFSGHNHLGQTYPDSVAKVGACTFVHTGVIAKTSRDGFRHSRFLEFGDRGFVLSTLDHSSGQCMVDVLHEYKEETWERYTEFKNKHHEDRFFSPPAFDDGQWIAKIGNSGFKFHQGMIVEYDIKWKSPLGIVAEKLNSPVVSVRDRILVIQDGTNPEVGIEPNSEGRYLQIFLPNPFKKKNRVSAGS